MTLSGAKRFKQASFNIKERFRFGASGEGRACNVGAL